MGEGGMVRVKGGPLWCLKDEKVRVMVSVTDICWNWRLWGEDVTSPMRRKAWNMREYIACSMEASYDDLDM